MSNRVRFFCDCGEEMWQRMDEMQKKTTTISEAEETCICAHCLLREVHLARADAALAESAKQMEGTP